MQSSIGLYAVVLSFAAGILARSFIALDFFHVALAALLALAVLACALAVSGRSRVVFFVTALVLIGFSLGVARLHSSEQRALDSELAVFTNARVSAVGTIAADPDFRERSLHLFVDVEEVNGTPAAGRVLVLTEPFGAFGYGDRVRFSGVLARPEVFATESGRVFNYPMYLAKDGIRYQVQFTEVEKIGGVGGHIVLRVLLSFKHALLGNIQAVIPDPEASLMGGLLLGAKQSLGETLMDAFRRTGIVHIVVLSGYNITIVADAVTRIVSFLPLVARFACGALAIVAFALMTGASATVVRASVMALLVLVARATGRTYDVSRALAAAGFLMLLENPYILAFDPSFQLSFLATIGLIYVGTAVEQWFIRAPTVFKIREVLVSTVSTQLFVLPAILYMVGAVSLVALPVNLLILVTVPFTMLMGAFVAFAGFVHTTFSLPFAFVGYALLAYQLKIVELFSAFPFASVTVGDFPFWAVLALYALILLWLWHSKTITRPSRLPRT